MADDAGHIGRMRLLLLLRTTTEGAHAYAKCAQYTSEYCNPFTCFTIMTISISIIVLVADKRSS